MNLTERRERFRGILSGNRCVHPGSVFDPLSARAAEDVGFEVAMFAGSIASGTVLGAPDLIVLTLSEFAQQIHRICRASSISLMVDADHGYGNALNVMRTITELERAGVAALTIEDTLLPAQYGHKSTDLIPVEEGVGKMRAALEARIDPAMSIIARTHAGQLDDDAAIARIRAYQAAGVDAICLVGVRDFEHLEKLAAPLTVPLMLVTYDNPALRDRERLARLGVRIVVNGHAAYFAAIKATYDCLREQRNIATNDLDASQLSTRYSTLDEYRIWAREYMDVKE